MTTDIQGWKGKELGITGDILQVKRHFEPMTIGIAIQNNNTFIFLKYIFKFINIFIFPSGHTR